MGQFSVEIPASNGSILNGIQQVFLEMEGFEPMSESPNALPHMPDLMTVARAAKYLGFHAETVRRAIRDERLEYYKPGRHYKISIEQLKKYLESSLCPARATHSQGLNGDAAAGQSNTGKTAFAAELRQARQMKKALDNS